MSDEYGIKEQYIKMMKDLFWHYPEIEVVKIFGSRAKGTDRHGSDIDLLLCGEEVDCSVVCAVLYALEEELPLPYHFDVLNENALASDMLMEIKTHCKIFYIKECDE